MSDDQMTLRLAKPKKKGFFRLIFSRLFGILILFFLQLFMVITVFGLFKEYIPHFTGIQIVFTFGMVLYLFGSDMDSSAKLTWMMIISIVPVPGTIFLAFTQTDIGHRAVRKRIAQLMDDTTTAIIQDAAIMKELESDHSGTDDLCTYVNHTGCFPIYKNTSVTYYPLGENQFEAILTEISKAESYIFMEYFIIEEGYMWGRILKLLSEKAAAGVDVRVMYDGMCEISLLPHDYPKRMERLGIRCKAFSPIMPFLSTHYNYRDHRKNLVIDGKVAFTGGVNLADEYINRKVRFGHWKDTAVMVKGDAARSFALMFLQMWSINDPGPVFDKYINISVPRQEHAAGYVMPYGDCPLDGEKVGENVYIDILNRATDYVHIMTPYLILDGELLSALRFAAERGVDVKIILPGIPDKKMAYALAKSHYKTLLKAGVKIYEYTPGFVHAKVFVSDDIKAVVGTINLDYRSLYHHFECAAYLYKVVCIKDIAADYHDTLTKCRKVTPESVKKEKLYYKLVGSVLKLIAPLM